MQTPNKRIKKSFAKNGKKLLRYALDGFYYFDDDLIEDKIDQAEIKFAAQGRTAIRSYIWSHADIRLKICQVAHDIYGTDDNNGS